MQNIFSSPFFPWLSNRSNSRFYPFYLAGFLMFCSLMLSVPHFGNFDPNSYTWQIIISKSQDLTSSLTYINPEKHLAKTVFRLTVPVIMRVCHLGPLGMIMLQYLLGFLTIAFSYKLSFRILKDPISSTFVAAGIVFLYFGRAGFFDIRYLWFDEFAFFALIMALYSTNVVAIFLFSSMAAWTDERGLIALSIVFLFHLVERYNNIDDFKFKRFFNIGVRALFVLASVIVYAGVRLWLSSRFNMHTPSSGTMSTSVLRITLPFMGLGMWTFLEGFWVLYLLAMVQALKNKNYFFLMIILLAMFCFTAVAACVIDITRSGSYLLPVIFVLLVYLQKSITKENLAFLLFICLGISFLFPPLVVFPDPLITFYESITDSIFSMALEHINNVLSHHNLLN